MADLNLTAMLCSRLCHDLIGPIGAVGNGVEILAEEEDPGMQQQALELLAHSADLASRRVKFYRLAFGAAGGEGVRISLGEARSTVREFLDGSRVELDWPEAAVNEDIPISKAGVKILLNLILLASEAVPRGGTLTIDLAETGDGLGVAAQGAGARLSDAASSALLRAEEPTDMDAKAAPARLAKLMALSVSGDVTLERGTDRIVMQAALPASDG